MTDKHPSIAIDIETTRVEQLYKRSALTTLALFSASSVYLLFMAKLFAWQDLLSWYTIFSTILLGRLLLYLYYLRNQHNHSLTFWLNIFRLSIFAVGLSLGGLSFFFFPGESTAHKILAITFPIGVTAASLTILLDFCSFFIYVLTLQLPVIYQLITTGEQAYLGISLLLVLLAFFFLKFSRKFIDNFYLTMHLRFENTYLVTELTEEKNKIDSRMARILNDGSSEIYVADRDSFIFLQVNRGAIENLGYREEELLEISLFDVFIDLDRNSLQQLLASLHEDPRQIVVHNGQSRRKDGSIYPVEARFQVSTADAPIIVATVYDITERKEWEQKLIHQANYDHLTGLLNRHYMQSYMESAFARAKRQKQKVALLFMDIDNFKDINDSLGHGVGDEILVETARRVNSILRKSDTPARTGGDEFTILIEQIEEVTHAEIVAEKLIEIFREPFLVHDRQVHATASIGISIYPDDGTTHDQLMQYADIAMYRAKEDGRNNYRFFSLKMRKLSEEQMTLATHLRNALANKEFFLHYQPKIDLESGRITGAEALIRWTNPTLGDISPGVFIPLAEKMGLIKNIGSWVLLEACKEAVSWKNVADGTLQVSVNVSPQQIRTGTLLEDVDSALRTSGLESAQLELEITENLLIYDSKSQLEMLRTLTSKGVRLALDDFGTGYSSLSYLKRFPVEVLKIDRSFIHDLMENENSKALVEAIIAMAKSLKLEIVAEGVESEEQLAFLRERDVMTAQGFFFSRPVPAATFLEMVGQQQFRSVTTNDKHPLD